MPCLEDLELLPPTQFSSHSGCLNWRFVLDEIRVHPSLLNVMLNLAGFTAGSTAEDNFFTVDIETCAPVVARTEREFEICSDGLEFEEERDSLRRYLEGKAEWDSRLDSLFTVDSGDT